MLKAFPTDAKFVYKQFPLPATMHPQALPAAKATIAAGNQGKFWEMHDKIFQNYRTITPDSLKAWAGELGLDVAKFEKDLNDPATQKKVDEDMAHGRAADVTGTPTFFVNGKRVMNRSVEGFKAMIEEALKKG